MSVTCASGSARWSRAISSTSIRRPTAFHCRRSTRRFSPARPAPITSACLPSTSHCSAALRTISSNVSKRAAAYLTLSFRVSTKSWPKTSGQSVLSSLESHIVPLVPGLADRLVAGIQMLDVGCGRGRIINRLAELYPKSRFTGMDLSSEAILTAWQEAAEKRLRNVEFIVTDLSNFDEKAEVEAFDLVTTFDAVHDQAKPLNVLKGIHRTLRRDGVYLMQDIKGSSDHHKNIDHPLGAFLYTISCMHCMTVSLAQGGEGLGAMWGEEKTREYLQRAGFRTIETHQLTHDIQNNWYVVRK